MYPGTMPINDAARRPAEGSFISQVKLGKVVKQGISACMYGPLQISGERRQRAESRCKHHADIADIDWKMKCMQDIVDNATGRHKPRVDSASDDTP